MIGTKSGVWRTRSVRRKPVEQRWSVDNMLMVGGVPWRLSDDDQDVDGPALRGGVIRLDGGGVLDEEQKQELRKIPRIVPPRAFNTSQEDYQRHGFTRTTRQKHSEACRQRMATEMADEEKVRTAKRKRQESMKIAMEVQEKDNIEKDDVVAEGRHYQVGGSSSSASALGETDVVMRTQAKRDRSEDDGTDLTERLNKRAKEMGV